MYLDSTQSDWNRTQTDYPNVPKRRGAPPAPGKWPVLLAGLLQHPLVDLNGTLSTSRPVVPTKADKTTPT